MKAGLYILLAVAGLGITWTCLCRIKVMTAATTLASIRYSIALLAMTGLLVAATGIGSIWFPQWDMVALGCLAFSALCVQASTSRLWRHRVPEPFSRPGGLDEIDSDWLPSITGGKR